MVIIGVNNKNRKNIVENSNKRFSSIKTTSQHLNTKFYLFKAFNVSPFALFNNSSLGCYFWQRTFVSRKFGFIAKTKDCVPSSWRLDLLSVLFFPTMLKSSFVLCYYVLYYCILCSMMRTISVILGK